MLWLSQATWIRWWGRSGRSWWSRRRRRDQNTEGRSQEYQQLSKYLQRIKLIARADTFYKRASAKENRKLNYEYYSLYVYSTYTLLGTSGEGSLTSGGIKGSSSGAGKSGRPLKNLGNKKSENRYHSAVLGKANSSQGPWSRSIHFIKPRIQKCLFQVIIFSRQVFAFICASTYTGSANGGANNMMHPAADADYAVEPLYHGYYEDFDYDYWVNAAWWLDFSI